MFLMMRESVGDCIPPFQGARPVRWELPLRSESIHRHDDGIAFGVVVQAHLYADEVVIQVKRGSALSGSPQNGFHGLAPVTHGIGVS